MNEFKKSEKKYNLLFISSFYNYFLDNSAHFSRMFNNLNYFYNHKEFNVIALQPYFECKRENKSLRKDIKCYYYKHIRVFNTTFTLFLDFNPFFIVKFFKIIRKNKIDLIHIESPFGIYLIRHLTMIPISYNSYNLEIEYCRNTGKYYYKIPPFLRFFYQKFIYFIEKNGVKSIKNINAISLEDKKKFIKFYRIPEEKIIVNSIGLMQYILNYPINKEIARDALKVDKNKFIVIFHGPYYNNNANKEAIDIIRKKISPQIKDKDILFLIAGKVPSLQCENNLKLLGYIKDLRKLLYAADIAIIPIFRNTGITTKVIDYLSAKIPVISTSQGAAGLFLKDNVHGYIVKNNNPIDEMIKKILELKNNPKKIEEFKKNISLLLESKYNWDKVLKNLENRYKEIIDKNF